jgi:diaminohydroxyphosphoribosylaminopyrimidine deaminase/5-amino-6-(5-phosphoribosylamino)uracil reductase
MQRAFAEASKGNWLFTAPNPLVGALALQGGHVVAYGHHAIFGGLHAEAGALQHAPNADELIVTLEPCSSTSGGKKQPPCTSVIIESGVERVVIGALDPDPRHAGAGVKILEAAGIEVSVLSFDDQFAKQNSAFLNHLSADVPFVIAKWAASADGFVAATGGKSKWISNASSRQEVHRLRGSSQAVLSASGTVVADNPRLNARDVEHNIMQAKVLVGCASKVDESSAVLSDSLQRIWFDNHQDEFDWATDQDHFFNMSTGNEVDLLQMCQVLKKQFNINRMLIEAGPKILNSFFEARLVHSVVKYQAPIILGGGVSACLGEGVTEPAAAIRLKDELRAEFGTDLRQAWLVE